MLIIRLPNAKITRLYRVDFLVIKTWCSERCVLILKFNFTLTPNILSFFFCSCFSGAWQAVSLIFFTSNFANIKTRFCSFFFNRVVALHASFLRTQPCKHQKPAFDLSAFFRFPRRTLKKQHPTFPSQTLLFRKLMFFASSLYFFE